VPDRLRRVIDRSAFLSAVNYAKGQLGYRFGLRPHGSGATHARLTVEQSVEYVHRCGEDYLRYAAIGSAGAEASRLEGKRILEVGPGDSSAMAIYLLAKGAASVVAVDAFDPPEDEWRQRALYRALCDSFTPAERARAERGLRLAPDGAAELVSDRLRHYRRTRIEDAPRVLAGDSFDLILSRAALEHVADVERSWAAMVALLEPAGAMWHKIDLRHHGYFGKLHPLHFLTVGERAWGWISSPDPTLNRRRVDTYRALAAATFRRTTILTTHVLDGGEILPHVERLVAGIHYGDRELELIRRIRLRLQPRFRQLTDEELLIGGIFLIAHDRR
jgi:hypothetical protein